LIVFSCGSVGAYCAYQRSTSGIEPASLEGEFKGEATYYNETKVGSHFSTCGIERGRSLDEANEKVYGVALNQAQFDPYTANGIPSTNPICQKKALVKGPKGEIKVRFVDRCPDCKEGNESCFLLLFNELFISLIGDLALTEDAFIAIAGELGTGHTNVEWHFI
jgi:expansin (peptidoglycan-binding protein)